MISEQGGDENPKVEGLVFALIVSEIIKGKI